MLKFIRHEGTTENEIASYELAKGAVVPERGDYVKLHNRPSAKVLYRTFEFINDQDTHYNIIVALDG